MALYLAFCGALAVRGVFIHASVINAFAGLLRGVALLLRVVSIRGADFAALLGILRGSFAALLLFGLPGYLLRLCCCGCSPPVLLLLCWGSAAAPHLL